MTWVLPEILIPLLLAVGLGVLIGWFLWRWRRRTIHASEWNQLAANAKQAKADEAAVRAAYEEANNERSILANQVNTLTDEVSVANDKASLAIHQAEGLAADIEIANSELLDARERSASLEAELLAASTSNEERQALDEEIDRLRKELEDGAVRRSQLEQSVEERESELEGALSELKELTRQSQVLQSELDTKSAEFAAVRDSAAAQTTRLEELESGAASAALIADQVHEAQTTSAELDAALKAARTELDVSQSRIADFDARLSTATADLDAAHARVSELEERARDDENGSTAIIGQLRVDLAERDRRIAALEAAAPSMGEHVESGEPLHQPYHADDTTVSATSNLATVETLGVASADHIDDLKVIRGIGPRMEELLATLGITSWEQLAGLDESGVARVDDALMEFPGRIERDQWVDQARELIARFPDSSSRPTRETFLNRTRDEDPFN